MKGFFGLIILLNLLSCGGGSPGTQTSGTRGIETNSSALITSVLTTSSNHSN